MKNINIKNGVDIHIVNAEKFKTNLLSVYFTIPYKRDTVTYAALLPSVLTRGSVDFPTLKDMSRHLDDLYSASLSYGVREKGELEVMYFTAEYISDNFINENLTDKIADFLKSLILNPLVKDNAFNEAFVKSEKNNLENSIKGLINDKKEYAETKCREAMFGKNGCGMPEVGYEEDLKDITPQNLYDFYLNVINNSKIDIFISGTVNSDAENTVKSRLANAFVEREVSYKSSGIAEYKTRDMQNVIENADVVQSKLCIGLICGTEPVSDDFYALVLANCIFGASPFSKLFNNVREKLSLAYYAFSRLTRIKSYMLISAGIQTENYQKAYDEIMVQYNKMIVGDIEDFEIEAAKNYLANAYHSLTDSLSGMEDYLLSQIILGTDETIDEFLNKLMAVKKDEIIKVMKKIKFDTVYFLKGKTLKEA